MKKQKNIHLNLRPEVPYINPWTGNSKRNTNDQAMLELIDRLYFKDLSADTRQRSKLLFHIIGKRIGVEMNNAT